MAIPNAWESEHAIRSPSFWICGYLQEFCFFLRAEQCQFFSSAVFTSLTSTLDIPLSFQCRRNWRSFWCWTSKSMVFREKVSTENPWIFFSAMWTSRNQSETSPKPHGNETSRKPVWNYLNQSETSLKPVGSQSETSLKPVGNQSEKSELWRADVLTLFERKHISPDCDRSPIASCSLIWVRMDIGTHTHTYTGTHRDTQGHTGRVSLYFFLVLFVFN